MSDDAFDEMVKQASGRVGTTLKGKWLLEDLLGVGGMGAVYSARHRNQKRVAIKLLHPELSHNAVVRERFLREGYVANSIQHDGAVMVFDDDVTDDGSAFLVMELLDGETLEARWERKGRELPVTEVLAFVDRVLDTLHCAHTQGIVHRDLKPENLFLTRDAQIKVLDFGIARIRELGANSHTQTGSVMGTPSFMPPEQARGRWDEVDGQSDLWALGATMFTLLSGKFVHEAATMNESLVSAATQRARSLSAVSAQMPASVVELVDRALAFDKASRWSDALDMQTGVRTAYAQLYWGEDEQTVLASAAAALPAPPTAGGGAGHVTEWAATAPTRPILGGTFRERRWLLLAMGVAVAFALAFALFSRGYTGENQAADAETAVVAPKAIVQHSEAAHTNLHAQPALPAAIAVDELPFEGASKQEKPSTSSPQQRNLNPTPSVASSAPTVPPSLHAKPSVPSGMDPFAGRE